MMISGRKVALAIINIALTASLLIWFWEGNTVCSQPTTINVATGNIISYNCHGVTVYITPARKFIHAWLIPIFLILMLVRSGVSKPRQSSEASDRPTSMK